MTGPVFVTGGSGVIGSALVARLRKDGDEVLALARSEAAASVVAAAGARPVRGDVLDEPGLERAMAGARLVYHVAGVSGRRFVRPVWYLPTDAAGRDDPDLRAGTSPVDAGPAPG